MIIYLTLIVIPAKAQKNIAINPSNQTGNPVCGGSNEAYYALIMANLAKDKLISLGYTAKVFEGDITGIPAQVNSWNLQSGGAHAFVSMHTNATATGGCGGTSRGTTTYYHPNFKQSDVILASKVQSSLTNCLDIKDNGFTTHWLDLAVLRGQIAPGCLEEALFHDNSSDAAILRSSDGQEKIASGVSNGIHRYFGGTGNPCGGAPPPLNDEPCSADTLIVQTTCNYSTYTLVKASKSAQVSDASCDQPSNVDVWFKFSIPKGNFSIHTNSLTISGNDCGMAIYTGTCSVLTEVACIIGGNPSQKYMPWSDNINLSVYAGQIGYIRLWEFGSVSNTGDFQICISGSGNSPCKVSSIEPASITVGTAAYSSSTGKDQITVNGQPNCAFTVLENCDWLSIAPMGGLLNNTGQTILNYTIDANTSGATRSCTVTVNESPMVFNQSGCTLPGPVLAINIVSGSNPSCTGQQVTYRLPEVTDAASYFWTLPDGTTTSTSSNSLSVIFPNPITSGSLKVKGVNGCGSGLEGSIQVTVNSTPSTPVIGLTNGVLSSVEASGNQWYYNNNPVLNAVNQTYIPLADGNYHVVVTQNGCPSQPSNIISVITGVRERIEEEGINVYPNPTTGMVNVLINKSFKSEFSVELFNENGLLLWSQRKNTSEKYFRINLTPFPSGLYILRINAQEFPYLKKLIKK